MWWFTYNIVLYCHRNQYSKKSDQSDNNITYDVKKVKNQHVKNKPTENDYRVATLSKSHRPTTGITMQSLQKLSVLGVRMDLPQL